MATNAWSFLAAGSAPAGDPLLPRAPGGGRTAFALAAGAHLALIAALAVALAWKLPTARPLESSAELWSATPQAAGTAPAEAEHAPSPRPAPAPPPPPPAPAPKTAAAPKVEPAPPPPTPARHADLAERKEKPAPKEDEPKPKKATATLQPPKPTPAPVPDKPRKDTVKEEPAKKDAPAEPKPAKSAKPEKPEKPAEKANDRKADKPADKAEDKPAGPDAAQLAKLREQNLRRMLGEAGGGAGAAGGGTAAADSGPSAGYGARVKAKIKPNIVLTQAVEGNPITEVEVRLAPDGSILSRRIVKSSRNDDWDETVLRAIDRTQTLPRDTDGRAPPALILVFPRQE